VEREFEVGDLVVMIFDFIESGVRLREGDPVILIDGPLRPAARPGIYWLVLSPSGIVIRVPQAYFNYDKPAYISGS
jgi:hypothetical protein